jgi:replication initiation and membrane attachment protein DnaB
VTEKDIRRVLLRHPWLPYEYARRIAEDLKRKTTSTPEGLRTYNREYMRLRRAEKRGEVSDVPGIIAGKYLKKKRRQSQKNETDESAKE